MKCIILEEETNVIYFQIISYLVVKESMKLIYCDMIKPPVMLCVNTACDVLTGDQGVFPLVYEREEGLPATG